MPTTERTTTGMNNNSTVQTYVNNTAGKFVSGRLIYASDINQIINGFNTLNDHVHGGITDLYGIDDYGNVSSYGTGGAYEEQNANSTGPVGMNGDVGTVSTGDTATAGKYNEMANAANAARSHYHQWDDRTS
jgi:hypothetical protein